MAKPPQNPNLKPICTEIDAIISMGYHNYRVFTDWVGLMFYAFQKDDPHYLEIMGKYANKEKQGMREADHFANATACLMEYMKKTNEEALGELFMEYASTNYHGQFFTPINLCKAIASLTLKDIPEDRKFIISDPACGASIMFIAAAKEMTFEQNNRAYFIGVDTDINCVRMSALNMMFFNLNSLIIWGNSLSLECKGAWETRRTLAFGGSLHELKDMEVAKRWMRPIGQNEDKLPMKQTNILKNSKINQLMLWD